MAKSFKGDALREIAGGKPPKGFPPDLVARARRKLFMLVHAVELSDLRSPPGNRLELLSGSRNGQYSIRINDRWRICFVWSEGRADNIEITDYH